MTSQENTSCEPTEPIQWGPLWYYGAPILSDGEYVCRGDYNNQLYLAQNTLWRKLTSVNSTEFTITGRVLDSNCDPVPSAIVDIWQVDPMGRYSDRPDGDCRGAYETDSEGRYTVRTHLPGSYGITIGTGHLTYGMELPPMILRHIHAAVFVPGRDDILVTQFTFPGDISMKYDIRAIVAGVKTQDDSLEFVITQKGDGSQEAHFDFVLPKNEKEDTGRSAREMFRDEEALKPLICTSTQKIDLSVPLPFCTGTEGDSLLFYFTLAPVLIYGPPLVVLIVTVLVLKYRKRFLLAKET